MYLGEKKSIWADMLPDSFVMSFVSRYLNRLMKSIDRICDEETKRQLFKEPAGACEEDWMPHLIKRHGYDPEKYDVDELIRAVLEHQNELTPGANEFYKEDQNTIYYKQDARGECPCPLVAKGIIEPLPVLCDCSLSLFGQFVSKAARRPGRTELVESALRGGRDCIFRIHLL